LAVLVYSEIQNLALDRAQANVTTDAPFSSAEIARIINDAFADIWEISGGSVKRVASATAWTSAQLATGIVAGILTDIGEVASLFQTTTSGSTGAATDAQVRLVELDHILHLRSTAGMGTYTVPKVAAITPMSTDTPADVQKMQLDYWPGVTGFYFPLHYKRKFSPIDSATVTTPDVTDLESRDIGLLAGARMAQVTDRSDLVPGILADISQRTQAAIARKLEALVTADR
jgi:hypothetical protein